MKIGSKEKLKNIYAVGLAALLGFIILTIFTCLIFVGFYFVALVFMPNHNPIHAGAALMFLFACLCFMFEGLFKKR